MDNHTIRVRKLYQEWASSYDDSTKVGVPYLIEEEIFIKTVNPHKGELILDVGCGTGRNIAKLLQHTDKVEGVDISKEMLDIARRKFPNLKFYEADIEKPLPLESNQYDKIICSLTFQFLKDIKTPLKEFKRVLKLGGTAFITDLISDAEVNWSDIEYKVDRVFKGSPSSVSTFRSGAEYKEAIEKAGLQLKEIKKLRVRENCKPYLTGNSYKKVQDKWAGALFIVTKEKD